MSVQLLWDGKLCLAQKAEGQDQLCQSHQLWQPFLHMQYFAPYSSAMRHVLYLTNERCIHAHAGRSNLQVLVHAHRQYKYCRLASSLP